ncbi:MAG: hypothetical protein AAB348_01550 [Patescibacteria group bacterium]
MKNSDRKIELWKKVEPKLQVADLILVKEKSLLSKTIRSVTKSYWSHIVIVLSVPQKDTIFSNVLVVGAEPHGIEVHRIQKYTRDFEFYDLGVKRVPGLSEEIKEKVLSYILNNVDIPYDYARLLGFLFRYFGHKIFLKGNKHLMNSLINKDAFICSSFIQRAFYETMSKEKRDAIIFGNNRESKFYLEEITPADVARSKNSKWIFNPHN